VLLLITIIFDEQSRTGKFVYTSESQSRRENEVTLPSYHAGEFSFANDILTVDMKGHGVPAATVRKTTISPKGLSCIDAQARKTAKRLRAWNAD